MIICVITGGLTALPACLYNCVSLIPFLITLLTNFVSNPCIFNASYGVIFRIVNLSPLFIIIFGLSDLASNVGEIPYTE